MHSQLNIIAVQEHIADLRRQADAERVAASIRRPRRQMRVRPIARVSAAFARIGAARA